MCRSKDKGGRRCPAHTNPEQIAAYNAIRRERYHANKNTLASPAKLAEITITTTGEPSLYETGQTITGTLTTDKAKELQEQDSFGFRKTTEHAYEIHSNFTAEDRILMRRNIIEHSYSHVNLLDDDQRRALGIYSGGFHNYLHRYIINGDKDDKIQQEVTQISETKRSEAANKEDPSLYQIQEMLYDFSHRWLPNNAFNKLVHTLDSAITKSPDKKQKIVYRGLPAKNNLFPTPHLPSGVDIDSEEATDYIRENVEKNVKVGQEVVFDSYLSTTSEISIAASFTTQSNVMAEFLTPHGLQIADASAYKDECETLLPRGQRYKIVGTRQEKVVNRYGFHRELQIISFVAINSKGEILDGTNDDPLPPLPGGNQ